MSSKIFFLLIFLYSLLFVTCNKSSNDCKWAPEPPVFFFQIKQNGKILPDIILRNMTISCIINGTKSYLSDVTLAIDNYVGKGILASRAIGLSGPRTFIIDYNNGFNGGYKNDTLFIDYSYATPSSNCQYVLNGVKFNGVTIIGDSTFGSKPVYVFNKL